MPFLRITTRVLAVLAAAIIVVVPVILVTTSMIDEAVGAARNIQTQIETGEWRPETMPFADMPARFGYVLRPAP